MQRVKLVENPFHSECFWDNVKLALSSVGCIRAFDRISRNIHQAYHVAGTVFCNDTQEDYEMVMVGTHDVAGGANASSIAYWISSSGLKY